MKYAYLVFVLLLCSLTGISQGNKVAVERNSGGMKLVVDGTDFMVNGMNWDYFPIGTNFSYSLWNQPDDIIMAALDAISNTLAENSLKLIALRGLAEQADNPAPDEAVLDAMDALL